MLIPYRGRTLAGTAGAAALGMELKLEIMSRPSVDLNVMDAGDPA
jgi:hypothetical protein